MALLAYAGANVFHRALDEGARVPSGVGPADAQDKVAQHVGAVLGVVDFGMELHRVDVAPGVFGGGDGVPGGAHGAEAGRQLDDVVAVAGPDFQARRQPGEQLRAVFDLQLGGAVLAALSGVNFAFQLVGEPLHAVADAEDGLAELQNFGVADGGVGRIDRGRAAGEHQAGGLQGFDFFERGGAR